MGRHIDTVRRGKPRSSYIPKVPDVAVEACEKTFDAADPTFQKTKAKKFDDMGVVALVCRHDIPLFMCNVDSPGEQQKYAFALLEHLMTLLPSNATILLFYDIGCILDASMNKVRHSHRFVPSSKWFRVSIRSYRTKYAIVSDGQRQLCMLMVMNGSASYFITPGSLRVLLSPTVKVWNDFGR
jgi:hypothetical protein